MPIDLTVPEVARHQGGAFTRAQASAEGWSPRQVTARLRSGYWVRVCGSGLAARGSVTALTRAWAAELSWKGAVASHLTAAELHRLPVPADDRTHVTAPDVKHGLRGIVAHHVPLDEADVLALENGPSITSLRRTAVDCLRILPASEGDALWAWLATRQLLRREDLEAEVAGSRGRWGTPRLARLLRATRTGALSEAERRLHQVLRRAGVTGWEANAAVVVGRGRTVVVDVLFRAQRVVIEVDGYAAHSGREAFVDDRRRQNELIAAGYLVLRFTWADLTDRPDEVVTRLLAALALRA